MYARNEDSEGLPIVTPMKMARINEERESDLSPVIENSETTGSPLVLDASGVYEHTHQAESCFLRFLRVLVDEAYVSKLPILNGLLLLSIGYVFCLQWKFLCLIYAGISFSLFFYLMWIWVILPSIEEEKPSFVEENEEEAKEEEA